MGNDETAANPMLNKGLAKAAVFLFVIGLVALLYRLTLHEEDPCDALQADVGAAVLADEHGDQDALVNRAILVRGECKPAEGDGDE